MLKRLRVIGVIFTYVVSSCWLMLIRAGEQRYARNGQLYAQRILRVLNVTVSTKGESPHIGAVVANHQSYLDILVLMAALPCRFVTFSEMRSVPGIGFLVGISRTLLVNRSRPGRVREDIRVVTEALRGSVPVVFFPEGSSFDGDYLRPFKPALFSAVTAALAPLHPCCLRYLALDGGPVTASNRHRLYYYGEMQLLPQLWAILNARSVHVELVWSSPILPEEHDRKQLAAIAHASIGRHFLPVGSHVS